ncbi:hypothetical protein LCGC14_0500690 [marine sediment metagenome]|uniref:Uncharacterized protein n=1 Tax=marine sediment metagenome TaxID=412755 RepID=A0A0F9S3X2_9ZZZZ
MTHTLHRRGNIKDLKEDYVILAMLAAGVNDKYDDSRQKLIKIAEILNEHNPVNMMSELGWKTSSTITAAYGDIETVKKIIQILKEEDFGISIVVSGLISEIEKALKSVDLEMHTVHFSLGAYGVRKSELLPTEKLLEITTMCGHHTLSPQSITHYVDLIKRGKTTVEKAAKKLTKPCVCGIVNTSRVIKILSTLVKE